MYNTLYVYTHGNERKALLPFDYRLYYSRHLYLCHENTYLYTYKFFKYISVYVLWQLLRVKVKPSRCVHNIIYVPIYITHKY